MQITLMLDSLGKFISRILYLIGGVSLVLLIPSFAWLVFGRYVLNSTPTWVEQVSLILMVFVTFPVAAAGVRDNSHLAVAYVRDSMPSQIAAGLAILSYIGICVFGFYMTRGGWMLAEVNWIKKVPIIHISDGWRYVPMVACGCGLIFYSILHILRILANWDRISQSPYFSDDLLDEDA
ncbi:TRAP transporter small permease [Thalassospira marina]|uniref:TRAP transporter small permease protein n=1 Tax=Thalassospira marina TaxID=2048283 RepID=A0A2N3KQV9_9PROT|nr:TRAP transporter small permease [Thalassospira marina]AUG55556.1 C4-dicarboxylate ABC transporter permease [Thalassospira marina]PKR52949.1 C4-dicarboxylate ABC transporter permease [Thalassospira marina]